jgi:hypothetical protein
MSVSYTKNIIVNASSDNTGEFQIIRGNITEVQIETGSSERKVQLYIECDGNRILPSGSGGSDTYITPYPSFAKFVLSYKNLRDMARIRIWTRNTDTTYNFSVKIVLVVD